MNELPKLVSQKQENSKILIQRGNKEELENNDKKFINEMLDKLKAREEEKKAVPPPLCSVKDSRRQSVRLSSQGKPAYRGHPYNMTSQFSSLKVGKHLAAIKENNNTTSSASIAEPVRKDSALRLRKESLNFEQDDEDIDLILNSLRATLDQLYSDRDFLKDLYREGRLFALSDIDSMDDKAKKKIEALRVMTDELYQRFYKSAKYTKLMKSKVAKYKDIRKEVGPSSLKLPTAEVELISRYQEPDDRGNYFDREDLFKPSPAADSAWNDPDFKAEAWAVKAPAFKKGFNSKFTRVNTKDINPAEKKLEDYFNRKQIVECTARNIITQPIKDIMGGQLADLQLQEERMPISAYCVFDKDGRLKSRRRAGVQKTQAAAHQRQGRSKGG